MWANSKGSGKTAHMCRLAWAFAGRLCDKYHNLMSWLTCCGYSLELHCRINSNEYPQHTFLMNTHDKCFSEETYQQIPSFSVLLLFNMYRATWKKSTRKKPKHHDWYLTFFHLSVPPPNLILENLLGYSSEPVPFIPMLFSMPASTCNCRTIRQLFNTPSGAIMSPSRFNWNTI